MAKSEALVITILMCPCSWQCNSPWITSLFVSSHRVPYQMNEQMTMLLGVTGSEGAMSIRLQYTQRHHAHQLQSPGHSNLASLCLHIFCCACPSQYPIVSAQRISVRTCKSRAEAPDAFKYKALIRYYTVFSRMQKGKPARG